MTRLVRQGVMMKEKGGEKKAFLKKRTESIGKEKTA